MIGSVKDQNSSLSQAGKTPKDTSSRKLDAGRYSAKVATSKMNSDTKLENSSNQVIRKTGNKIKGSYEGLMYSPSTVLQFNGTGYDRKSNQQARFSKNTSSFQGQRVNNSFTSKNNYSIMDNYSGSTSKDSSSFRLTNIVKSNMEFK